MTYSYDEAGRSHKIVAYEPDGQMKKSWLYAYNDKGLMAEEQMEDNWSYSTWVHAYEYDSRGNWIKRITTVNERPKPGEGGLERSLGFKPDEIAPKERRIIISRKIAYY